MVKISVIVPVYKVEKYLNRCIDSIVSQTFRDFDLILVDDGSPDSCPKLCDEYARLDQRIHVIHKKNGGLSSARNCGIDWSIKNSTSDWITFIDSDDFIHCTMLENLYNGVISSRKRIAVCNYVETSDDFLNFDLGETCFKIVDTEEFYVNHTTNATIACGKLYSKDCFSSFRYPVGKLHEDEFLTYRLLFEQKQIVYIDNPLYAYYINQESITKSSWNLDRLVVFQAFDEQLDYFYNNRFIAAYQRRIRSYLWVLNSQYFGMMESQLDDHKKSKKLLRNIAKRFFKKYKKEINPEWEEFHTFLEIYYPFSINLKILVHRLLRKDYLL